MARIICLLVCTDRDCEVHECGSMGEVHGWLDRLADQSDTVVDLLIVADSPEERDVDCLTVYSGPDDRFVATVCEDGVFRQIDRPDRRGYSRIYMLQGVIGPVHSRYCLSRTDVRRVVSHYARHRERHPAFQWVPLDYSYGCDEDDPPDPSLRQTRSRG